MAKIEITNDRGIIVRKGGEGVYLNSGLMGRTAGEIDSWVMGMVMLDCRQAGAGNKAGVAYISVPRACTIERVRSVLGGGALTVTDTAISIDTNDGNGGGWTTGVSAITITQAGSAAGDVDDTGALTTGNAVAAGGIIRFISDGASGGGATRPVFLSVTLRLA